MNDNLKSRLKEFFRNRVTTDENEPITVYDLKCTLTELQNDPYNNWNQDIKELNIIISLMDAAGINQIEIY